MKVKDLIKQLVDFDGDEDVFIGIGPSGIPDAGDAIVNIIECNKTTKRPYGIYLVPESNLEVSDE